jgi:hypothetical protein
LRVRKKKSHRPQTRGRPEVGFLTPTGRITYSDKSIWQSGQRAWMWELAGVPFILVNGASGLTRSRYVAQLLRLRQSVMILARFSAGSIDQILRSQPPETEHFEVRPSGIRGAHTAFLSLKQPLLHEKERCHSMAFVLISKTLIRLPPHAFRPEWKRVK